MSGKKYKPALFELLGKGTVKPNENGSLSTPGWMRGQTKNPFAWLFRRRVKESSDSESAVTIHGLKSVSPVGTVASVSGTGAVEPAKPVTPAMKPPVPAAAVTAAAPKAPIPAAAITPRPPAVTAGAPRIRAAGETGQAKDSGWFVRIPGNRLQVVVNYKVAIAAGAVLLVLLLLVFRLGQSRGRTVAADPAQATVAQTAEPVSSTAKLNEIRQGAPRTDILPEQAVKAKAAEAVQPAASEAVSARKGLSLVICSHTNQRELGQVQAYFARKGVPAEIGQFDNRYVLYSVQTFETITQAKQSKLKDAVVELGRRYNSEREKGAAIFQAKTFESAWWINIEKIRQVH